MTEAYILLVTDFLHHHRMKRTEVMIYCIHKYLNFVTFFKDLLAIFYRNFVKIFTWYYGN